ncbi:MAG: hypothetical protein HYX69_19880 [Planctomycetia bacterium]|nr:hypothetical protein [Planctomycetia bacterium]
MVKESRLLDAEPPVDSLDAPSESQTLLDSSDSEPRELWRVVSTDGSTRIFQTKPGAEQSAGKRAGVRRALPCALKPADGAPGPLAQRHDAALPTVIAEQESSGDRTADAELSAEITSVTQAWRTLSPGIRGAIMALVRASATARQHRAIALPRRE